MVRVLQLGCFMRLPGPRMHSESAYLLLLLTAGHQLLKSPSRNLFLIHYLLHCGASAHSPLCSPCSAPFPSISLSVCLIAGDGHVVYLTQNRTPLLFQRVEPPSPAQDGGPGLNNALPPPETIETANSL